MAKINANYQKLAASYLFAEIARRVKTFEGVNAGVKVFRLGIGNTTEPLTPHIIKGLRLGVDRLADVNTYTGYGAEQGETALREAIAGHYGQKGMSLDPSEVFISDGAKPDSANIQSIFAQESRVAVQDPAYPVYVDTNVIAGRTGVFNTQQSRYEGLVYMPCTVQTGFIPRYPLQKPDLVYLCSPNNPTGAVMPKESLEGFVAEARKDKAVIIFDAAYNWFISDKQLPWSIYEAEGAKECAIELNSFSKIAGFTGARLGWTVVPKSLVSEEGETGLVHSLWNRRQTTFFNGASNIVQVGGLYALSPQGLLESQGLVDYYMRNAQTIRTGLKSRGLKVYGGVNAPYLWMENPRGMKSWDFFDKMLQETHVATTPGVGFGPAGEGYTRLSAFGHRENVEQAVESIVRNLQL